MFIHWMQITKYLFCKMHLKSLLTFVVIEIPTWVYASNSLTNTTLAEVFLACLLTKLSWTCRCIGHSLDLNLGWCIALFQSVAHWQYLREDLYTLFSEGYAVGLLMSDCYKKTPSNWRDFMHFSAFEVTEKRISSAYDTRSRNLPSSCILPWTHEDIVLQLTWL